MAVNDGDVIASCIHHRLQLIDDLFDCLKLMEINSISEMP